jgi:hypothetical protein
MPGKAVERERVERAARMYGINLDAARGLGDRPPVFRPFLPALWGGGPCARARLRREAKAAPPAGAGRGPAW